MKKLLLLLLLSLTFLGQSFAGEYAYECTIGNVYALTDDGKIEETHQNWQGMFQGEKFYVSRLNGEIVGSTLPTALAKEVRIINPGSSEYDFQTIAIFETAYADEWQVLSIQEFVEGNIKPFSAFTAAGITSGTCE
jgi:hypothetical protein